MCAGACTWALVQEMTRESFGAPEGSCLYLRSCRSSDVSVFIRTLRWMTVPQTSLQTVYAYVQYLRICLTNLLNSSAPLPPSTACSATRTHPEKDLGAPCYLFWHASRADARIRALSRRQYLQNPEPVGECLQKQMLSGSGSARSWRRSIPRISEPLMHA